MVIFIILIDGFVNKISENQVSSGLLVKKL